MGILPVFEGWGIHDGWIPDFKFGCLHALCNVHNLSGLIGVEEVDGQGWPDDMIDQLLKSNERSKEGRSMGSDFDLNEFVG